MSESDRLRTYLTGRQSAHMKFTPRKPQQVDRDTGTGRANPLPVVSVVSWEVHEEICEPYRIKAVISTPEPVSRKKVLGHLAEFSIQPEDGREMRTFNGFVSRFDLVSESRDGCSYHVVVRQRLALLDGPSNCVTYQRMTSWEIIKAILERHEIRFWMQIEFRLKRVHPRHDFRFQFNIGDWAYIRLEMEQAGLFCFTTADEHGEVLVIADDVDGYERPPIMVLDRPTAGLSTFEEAIFAFRVRTRTVPESFAVADYNPESAWEVLRNESRVVSDDETMVGTPYVWGTHHGDAEGAKREAKLRHEAALAQQVRYKVKSTVLALRPGRVVRSDRELEDTTWGMFITKVVHSGARDASYMNRFTAIPADRPYRMAIDENRWPRIHGTLGATICSPDKYKFAFLTDKGEYIARFHCDFGNWPKGAESVPLRLAKPFSGKNNTGMHMPALDGDEALVAFREGNPNKPILAGFMPNSQRPDLINSSRRRISRNEIRTQSGNKMWMDDWDDQQGIELSTEHSGRSQLNLGFIPDRELKERGTGAELRTSGHLVGRGGAGAMLTAYNQAGGSGKVLAMDETDAQLKDHQVFVKSLADSAGASKASPADLDAQKGINDGLKELKKPGVLVTGPGPVGVASGDGVHLAADGSIIGTAKKGVHFSTLKRFTVAARDMVSMFSQKGMSLITSAGDFVAQAQRGRMQLASQEDMSVESVNGVVHVKAAKEIILNVNGTYVKVSGSGVEIGSRGAVLYRTAGVKGTGPAQMDLGGAAFAPVFVPYTTSCEVWRTSAEFPDAMTPETQPVEGPDAVANSPLSGLKSLFAGNKDEQATGTEGAPASGESEGPAPIPQLSMPVKMDKPDPCGSGIGDLKRACTVQRETPSYFGYGSDKSQPLKNPDQSRKLVSGPASTTWALEYKGKDKLLTATVKIGVELWDILAKSADGKYLTEPGGAKVSFPFGYDQNAGHRRDVTYEEKPFDGDASIFDFANVKSRIESVLNQGGHKLIMDCPKGAACGCRVAVKFQVEFKIIAPGSPYGTCDQQIRMFMRSYRANNLNWGYLSTNFKQSSVTRFSDDPDVSNVQAHECGHLFAYPDEYFEDEGGVHKEYVSKAQELRFDWADAMAGKPIWKIHTATNVMGLGCNFAAAKPGQAPTATIEPYYLEYVRSEFSKGTNKKWKIGYE
ncbi:type VI secretion system Vgr family protein [Caballeronia telluris]|uniref:Rhs element Vgr protein n=1 Tax=Caballeronia telluris TaxID=326475 RepID=A0A158HFD6_9BURK|nr:type VI secretion system Vgr family protein [Caballeronia telluris]SAL43045.1 Rhs element Vgr protein [Caballeronia telluris]